MSENTEKLFAALSEDPALMEKFLAAKHEGPTRAMPGQDPVSQILQGILKTEDVSAANDALDANGLMQLYLGADGDIDARELMDYVGGFAGTKADNDPSVRALLDGKLDFKEILMLIAILKLLKGKKKPAQNSGLIGSLLGANQQPQTNSAMDLFSSMLGAHTAQPSYSNSLFGNLFGAPQPSNPQVFAFGTPANTSSGMNVLQSLLGGNTGVTAGNSQAQQIYSLLNGNANNAFNSNGSINVGTLFSLASQLMGMR